MTSRIFKRKVKKLIIIQTTLIVLLVMALTYVSYNKFKPVSVTISAPDECVPIGGRISHSIEDDGDCQNACHAMCGSIGKEFLSSEFDFKSQPCYTCDCVCN